VLGSTPGSAIALFIIDRKLHTTQAPVVQWVDNTAVSLGNLIAFGGTHPLEWFSNDF